MSKAATISLETTHRWLGWPTPTDITNPQGAGASVFARLVREKIGNTLWRLPHAREARIGVLMADSNSSTSEPPVAIVAEFDSSITANSVRELHRLSWNFSHAPTVITIEPALLRVWSCCEVPDLDRELESYVVERLSADQLTADPLDALEVRAARALHWVNLVSGQFFAEHASRFDRDGRADQMLLENLRHIRNALYNEGLTDDDICHDLLARVIFVQFLFDRKDHDGNAALNLGTLRRLRDDGVLEGVHLSFASLLSDYHDTYRLFEWLNAKFNGDLFPGQSKNDVDQATGWSKEKEVVTPQHLLLLAKFVKGGH